MNRNNNNYNNQNEEMNPEVYEDKAVNRSRLARNIALGAALAGGGGIAAAAATRAAMTTEEPSEELTTDDLFGAASAGDVTTETQEKEYVYVEKPAQKAPVEDKPEENPQEDKVVWDEQENIYVNGEKVMSVETGSVDGQKFAIADYDGDNVADVIAVDENNNGIFEDNEFHELSYFDNVRMGHDAAHSNNYYMNSGDSLMYADNSGEEKIHNNFEDEKTGENYQSDYAENNPDYNPDADGENNQYYASIEMDKDGETYQEESTVSESSYMADNDITGEDPYSVGGEEEIII